MISFLFHFSRNTFQFKTVVEGSERPMTFLRACPETLQVPPLPPFLWRSLEKMLIRFKPLFLTSSSSYLLIATVTRYLISAYSCCEIQHSQHHFSAICSSKVSKCAKKKNWNTVWQKALRPLVRVNLHVGTCSENHTLTVNNFSVCVFTYFLFCKTTNKLYNVPVFNCDSALWQRLKWS